MPSSVFGQNAPSNRITLGIIGCGNQSTVDIPEWLKNDDCQIVAVCDVNKASYGYKTEKQFLGREPQRDFINQSYAKKTPSGLFTAPTRVAFRARFACGAELYCHTDPRSTGVRFVGTEGWVDIGRKDFTCEPASLKDSVIGPDERRLYVSENHYRNFLDCVKSRQDPIEPVETGHRTSMLCHLGNIAMRLKRKIKFDPQTEQIVGDDGAAGMLARPLRAPWSYSMPVDA